LFLCGDVMTGRGIDQIMAHPGDPALYEPWAKSAVEYVNLAERRSGPIPRAVGPEYIWGDALEALDDSGAAMRVINLETAVTDRGRPWPGKGIHYRMHPANLGALRAAAVDCCVLANNHVLDWSHEGLDQTLSALHEAGLASAGAGSDLGSATSPAILESAYSPRVVVAAIGMGSSGIPGSWGAADDRPGVAFAGSASDRVADAVVTRLAAIVAPGDLVLVSVHWGPNWGYDIPGSHRRFARRLIDTGAVHVVHGHSSHHPLGMEIHRGRLILYGCGDLINDYEGIRGHEEYRPDLGILYLASLESVTGALEGLYLIPMRMRRFRLERAQGEEREWLVNTLDRESRPFGAGVVDGGDGRLRAVW
jgi:poly-gamma-glutamate capsule biosynthesis protein CapA/YwtB (metallophosphatase superfamily)